MSKKNIEVTIQEMAEKEAKKIVDQVLADSETEEELSETAEEETSTENVTIEVEGETDKEAETEVDMEQELAKAQEETAQWRDKFLRLAAEFENYKRRTSRERIDLIKTAGKDVIVNMLPVLDDFDRAFAASEKVSDPSAQEALKGFNLITTNSKVLSNKKDWRSWTAKGKSLILNTMRH